MGIGKLYRVYARMPLYYDAGKALSKTPIASYITPTGSEVEGNGTFYYDSAWSHPTRHYPAVPLWFVPDFGGPGYSIGWVNDTENVGASSITSFPDFSVHESIPITIKRFVPNFLHQLELIVGGVVVAVRKNIATTIDLTLNLEEKRKTYSAMRGTNSSVFTLRCTTFNGTTQIGPSVSKTAVGTVTPSIISDFPSFDIDGSSEIVIERVTGFSHTLKLFFGEHLIATRNGISDSLTLTLSTAEQDTLYALIPDSDKAKITARLTTFSGSAQVGRQTSKTSEARVPMSVVPTFTPSFSEGVPEVAQKVGAYVQGKSCLNVAITEAQGAKGSSIISKLITIDGLTLTTENGRLGPLPQAGSRLLVFSVTDSRRRKTIKTFEIEVLPYVPPQIEKVTIARSDATGESDPVGSHLTVYIKGSVSSVFVGDEEKNSLRLIIKSKTAGDGFYTPQLDEVTLGLTYDGKMTFPNHLPEHGYSVQIILQDVFGFAISEGRIPTGKITMLWGDDYLSIGGFREHPGSGLEVKGGTFLTGQLDVEGAISNDYFYMTPIKPSGTDVTDLDIMTLQNSLRTEYESSPFFSSTQIGTSVGGIPIYDMTVGRGGVFNRHLLVVAGMHGKEYQGAYVLYNTIRWIMENLAPDVLGRPSRSRIGGELLVDIFSSCTVHFVLSGNPDIYQIAVDPAKLNDLSTAQQTAIKSRIEAYVRAGRLRPQIDVTQTRYDELNDILGGVWENYVYDARELGMYNTNLNGVDLHYNCFDEANASTIKAYAKSSGWENSPAMLNYIGIDYNGTATQGFTQPENQAIKALMESYDIRDVINIHQRGPTCFWNYKQGGRQFERTKRIAEELGRVTNTPINHDSNGQVGFGGWFYANFKGDTDFACIKEIGRSSYVANPSGSSAAPGTLVSPLPKDMLVELYESEKYAVPFYAQLFLRQKDTHRTLYDELSLTRLRDIVKTGFINSLTNASGEITITYKTPFEAGANTRVTVTQVSGTTLRAGIKSRTSTGFTVQITTATGASYANKQFYGDWIAIRGMDE